jgi:hypothetical protein
VSINGSSKLLNPCGYHHLLCLNEDSVVKRRHLPTDQTAKGRWLGLMARTETKHSHFRIPSFSGIHVLMGLDRRLI